MERAVRVLLTDTAFYDKVTTILKEGVLDKQFLRYREAVRTLEGLLRKFGQFRSLIKREYIERLYTLSHPSQCSWQDLFRALPHIQSSPWRQAGQTTNSSLDAHLQESAQGQGSSPSMDSATALSHLNSKRNPLLQWSPELVRRPGEVRKQG